MQDKLYLYTETSNHMFGYKNLFMELDKIVNVYFSDSSRVYFSEWKLSISFKCLLCAYMKNNIFILR